jgi:hypothetical protein
VCFGQEADDCVHELLPVEQSGVVVVGPGDRDVARPRRRLGHSEALVRGTIVSPSLQITRTGPS